MPIIFLISKNNINYFTSTSAPAAVNFSFIALASSFGAASLITPPLSTKSLASFNPNPVIALTSLITAILFPPAFFNTTSNSVFSSAASTGPAAATATGAAAVTPKCSSSADTNSF